MPEYQNLGKLKSSHRTSPMFVQRAAIVALVSFAFFLVMLAAFYVRPQIGYFVLAISFLVVDLFTLIGIWMQKRNIVNIHENGIVYKKFRAAWNEIDAVQADKSGLLITKSRESAVIPVSIEGFDSIVRSLKTSLENSSDPK